MLFSECNFQSDEHTLERWRDDWSSRLFDRKSYFQWEEKGRLNRIGHVGGGRGNSWKIPGARSALSDFFKASGQGLTGFPR